MNIATRYGLEGPRVGSRWGVGGGGGEILCILSHRPWSPPMNTEALSPGVKRPGRGVNQSPPSRAEVKEREELYFYTLSVPLRQVIV